MAKSYFVYILSNRLRTVLYTGVTGNLSFRLEMHLAGRGSAFVRRYSAYHLVYFESHNRPEEAIAREKQIKGWRREKKLQLILRQNPKMSDLRDQLL